MSKIRLTDPQRMVIADIVNNYLYGEDLNLNEDPRILRKLKELGLIKVNMFKLVRFAAPTERLKFALIDNIDLYEITDCIIMRSFPVHKESTDAYFEWAKTYGAFPPESETEREAWVKFVDLSVNDCTMGMFNLFEENNTKRIQVRDVPSILET